MFAFIAIKNMYTPYSMEDFMLEKIYCLQD